MSVTIFSPYRRGGWVHCKRACLLEITYMIGDFVDMSARWPGPKNEKTSARIAVWCNNVFPGCPALQGPRCAASLDAAVPKRPVGAFAAKAVFIAKTLFAQRGRAQPWPTPYKRLRFCSMLEIESKRVPLELKKLVKKQGSANPFHLELEEKMAINSFLQLMYYKVAEG